MSKVLVVFCVVVPTGVAFAQPVVRDHREVPGAAAQWKVGGAVDPIYPAHRLYNTVRRTHLGAKASGALFWDGSRTGSDMVQFENCTRPGETIYSSDRVRIRFGGKVAAYSTGMSGLSLTASTACDFRLVSSGPGMAAAGSGDGRFAIYSISANRYLTYRPIPRLLPTPVTLRWEPTSSGRPPRNVAARADFLPTELIYTVEQAHQTVYLTIKNVGNVRSSASQQEMKVKLNGEETTFLIVNPVEPAASLRGIVKVTHPISTCSTVELDTNSPLKFQVGQAAFPNDDVFANDRRTLTAVRRGHGDDSRSPAAPINCEPQLQ